MGESGEPARLWSVDGRSAIGAAHVAVSIPNQDAIAWAPRKAASTAAVLALADGHGAAAHFRSGIGAHMAVEAATAVLEAELADPSWIARNDLAHARTVAHKIIAHWRAMVLAHLSAHPIEREGRRAGADPFLPYGSTFIAAAVAPPGLFVIQLGDGDLLLGAADGAVSRPLPSDQGLIGEQTYSLCQADAERRARMRVLTGAEDIDFVMLSTDGLSKSFAEEAAFTQLAASWRRLILETGLPAFADRLTEGLSDISRKGSGDDITVGVIVGTETCRRENVRLAMQC